MQDQTDSQTLENLGLPEDARMEIGTEAATHDDSGLWYQVSFDAPIEDAVVVVGAVSGLTDDPLSVRVRNVTEYGFEYQIDNWTGSGTGTGEVTFSWMAGTEGEHMMGNGDRITFLRTDPGEDWNTTQPRNDYDVDFERSFTDTPMAFAQVIETGDGLDLPTTARLTGISETGLSLGVQVEEAARSTILDNDDFDVGVVVFSPSEGSIPLFDTGTAQVDHDATDTDTDGGSAIFAAMQAMAGSDTATLRYETGAGGDLYLVVQEEQSADAETTHAAENVAYLQAFEGEIPLVDYQAEPVHLEIGQADISQAGPDEWIQVSFLDPIEDPLVVLGPVSDNDGTPLTTRVRNVTETGFELQIDEWDYLDGIHGLETISWVAGPEGDYILQDGTHLSLTAVDVSGIDLSMPRDMVDTDIASDFETTPFVFGQVMVDDAATTALDYRVDTNDGDIRVGVQVEEAGRGDAGVVSDNVQVAVLAIDPDSTGSIFSAGGTAGIGHSSVDVATLPDSTDALIAGMQTIYGSDAASLRYDIDEDGALSLRVGEEQSFDSEVTHTAETVAWLSAQPGSYALTPAVLTTEFMETGTLGISQPDGDTWYSVSFSSAMTDPVVIMGPVSSVDGDPVHTRVRNVTETGFEFQLEEWEAQDGIHGLEQVSWMAGSEGTHILPDGRLVTFGTDSFDSESGGTVGLDAYLDTPLVFAQVIGDDPSMPAVVDRITSADASGFSYEVHAEEALRGDAGTFENGTLTWAAFEDEFDFGDGDLPLMNAPLSGTGQTVPADTTPAIFLELQSMNDPETANLRFEVIDDEVFYTIEEDQSADAEMEHGLEEVATLVLPEIGVIEFYDYI